MNNLLTREMMGSMVSKREDDADVITDSKADESEGHLTRSYATKMDAVNDGHSVHTKAAQLTDDFVTSIPMDSDESSSSSSSSRDLMTPSDPCISFDSIGDAQETLQNLDLETRDRHAEGHLLRRASESRAVSTSVDVESESELIGGQNTSPELGCDGHNRSIIDQLTPQKTSFGVDELTPIDQPTKVESVDSSISPVSPVVDKATPPGSNLTVSNRGSTTSSMTSSDSQDSSKKSSRWDRGFALQRTPEKSTGQSLAVSAVVTPTVVMARGVKRGLSFANNLGFRMCYQGFSLRFGNGKSSTPSDQQQPSSLITESQCERGVFDAKVDAALEQKLKSEPNDIGMDSCVRKSLSEADDELNPADVDAKDITRLNAKSGCSSLKTKIGKFRFLVNDDRVDDDGGCESIACNGLSTASSTRSGSPSREDSDSGGACNAPSSANSELDDNNSTPTDSQSDSGALGLEVSGSSANETTTAATESNRRRRGPAKRGDKKKRPNEERRRSSRIRSIAERREKEREEKEQQKQQQQLKEKDAVATLDEQSAAEDSGPAPNAERSQELTDEKLVPEDGTVQSQSESMPILKSADVSPIVDSSTLPSTPAKMESGELSLILKPAPPPPMFPPLPPNPPPSDYAVDTDFISVELIPLPPMPPPPRPVLVYPHRSSLGGHHSSGAHFRQNSSSPTSGGEDSGSGGGGRPEKVKSRWRRNSELERVCSNPPSHHFGTPRPVLFSVPPPPLPPPPPPSFNWRPPANCASNGVRPAFDILLNGGLMGSVLGTPPPPPPPVCGFWDPGEIDEDWSEKEVTSSLSKRPLPMRPRIVNHVTAASVGTTDAPVGGDGTVATAADGSRSIGSSAKSSPSGGVVSPAKDRPAYLNFEEIAENTYLSERRRCKSKREVRRMVCDCSLTKDEMDEGFIACGDDCLNRLLMMECGSRCPTGDRCTNRRFQKRQYANIAAFKTEKKGWGLKTQEDLAAGAFVLEYVGEVLDQREFKRRVKEYAHDRHRHYYFMALRNDEIIDATQRGNLSRFINHSCDPNCETQKWTVNGELRVGFFTRRIVAAGDELTFDYQFQRYGKEAQRCYCEAAVCRGFIGGDKQTPLKKDRRDVRRKKAAEERRREDLEDMDLEEEIEKFSHLGGLKNRTQTLNLCRLMVRAEEIEFRLVLLQSLQKTTEQACLRLFLDYHGLSLVWSWMVDVGNGDDNLPLKTEILKTLQKLPITNKNVLMDSKVMSVVQRWSQQIAEQTHHRLASIKESSSEDDPMPPTLTKENGISTTEDSYSDNDSVQAALASAAPAAENTDEPEPSEVDAADDRLVSVPCETLDDGDTSKVVLTPNEDAAIEEGELVTDSVADDELTASVNDVGSADVEESDKVEEESEGVVVNAAEEAALADTSSVVEVATAEPMEEGELRDVAMELSPPVLNNEAQLSAQSHKLRVEGAFANLAKELLEIWSSLKEVYRIPKREQNQNRRDHEREADKRESEERERDHRDRGRNRDRDGDRDGHRDRDGRHRDRCENDHRKSVGGSDYERGRRSRDDRDSPSTRDQRKTRDRDRRSRGDDDEPERKRPSFYDDTRRQSKVERRREFELQVQQADEAAYAKQAATNYINHFRGEHEAYMMTLHMDPMYFEPNFVPMPPQGAPIHGPPIPGAPLHGPPIPGTPMPYFDNTVTAQYGMPPPLPMGPPPDQVLMVSSIPTPDTSGDGTAATMAPSTESPVLNTGAPPPMMYPSYPPPPNPPPVPLSYVGGPPPPPGTGMGPHFIQPPHGPPMFYPQPPPVPPLPDQLQVPPHSWPHVAMQTPIPEETPPPPEPSKPVRPAKLPSKWRIAKDPDGTVYYYHTGTRQVQWDAPAPEESDMDLGTPTYDEPKQKKKKAAFHENCSETARRIKEGFRMKMSQFIVQCLNPYRKPDCKLGHIVSTEEFKHLARKLTHFVMAKELKHCRNVEDLECNENVKHKAKDFVRKYMSKFGPVYKKSPKDDDDDDD